MALECQGGLTENPEQSRTKPAARRTVAESTKVDKRSAADAPQNGIIPFAVYTLAEAAALLKVSERKVRDLEATGQLPRLRHTRNFVVWGEDLIAFLRSVSATKAEVEP